MSVTFLLWVALATLGVQSAPPLSLELRVFRGPLEVTRETDVTVFGAGAKTDGRAAPLAATGERRLSLAAGAYDLQLVQQQEGKVLGIAWTTLRLLVEYPGERGQHLEVLNFDKRWGALHLREDGPGQAGPVPWSARLLRKDGAEVARGVPGPGYQLLVAPAGTYDVAIARAGVPVHMHDVEISANLTTVRRF